MQKTASNRTYNIQQIIQPNLPQMVQKLPSYGTGKGEELPVEVSGNEADEHLRTEASGST